MNSFIFYAEVQPIFAFKWQRNKKILFISSIFPNIAVL